MAYKGIRIVALMSLLMAALWGAVLAWAAFGSETGGTPVSIKAVSQAFSLLGVLLATLASYVSQILERQADQIASLERTLAELQPAKVGPRQTG